MQGAPRGTGVVKEHWTVAVGKWNSEGSPPAYLSYNDLTSAILVK